MNHTESSLSIIAKGAGIVFIGLFISKLLGYAFRLIVARFGSSDYGLLSLGMAVFGVFTVISVFGLIIGVTRYVSFFNSKKQPQKVKGVILFASKTTLILSLIASFVMFFFSDFISLTFFHNLNVSIFLKIFALALPFDVLRSVFFASILGFKKIVYEMFSRNVVENSLKVLITLFALFLGYGIVGAAIAYVIAIVISFFLSFYFLEFKVFSFLRSKIKPIYSNKELLKYSLPLLLSEAVLLVILWTDTLMLGFFKSSSDVGIYNAALPTSQLLYFFPYALTALFLPVLTELYAKKLKDSFASVFKAVTKWIFMINIVIFSLFLIFSSHILRILFGSEYSAGNLVLITLSVGYLLTYLALSSNQILLILKKTSVLFWLAFFGAVVNIFLNFLLIPRFGYNGAGLATSITLIITSLLTLAFAFKFTKVFPLHLSFLKISLSALLSGILIYYISSPFTINLFTLILYSLLFSVFYLFCLYVLRTFNHDDKFIINSIKRKFMS